MNTSHPPAPLCSLFPPTSRAHALTRSHIFLDEDNRITRKSSRFVRIKSFNCIVPIWWCLSGLGLCLPLKVIPFWQMMVKRHCYVISCRPAHWQVCWFYNHCTITDLMIQICLLMCKYSSNSFCSFSFWLRQGPNRLEDKELWLRFRVSMVPCTALHCTLTQRVLSLTLSRSFLLLK